MRTARPNPDEDGKGKKRKKSWSDWQAEKKAAMSSPEGKGGPGALNWWSASQAHMQPQGSFASSMYGGWQPFGGSGSGQTAESLILQALANVVGPWAAGPWQQSSDTWQQ